MADKISDSEKQYYEAVVAETVKEVSKVPKDKAEEAEALIQQVLAKESLHDDLVLRFRRDVLKRATELKNTAKEDEEKKIVEKFEGKVEMTGGKLRFAGVQEKFNVKVRVGNLAQRMWRRNFDADKLDETMREVARLEEEIEKNKVELEMLKSARDATSSVLGLTKDIFKSKLEAKGKWGTIFSREMNLWQSYKAAKTLKVTHQKEYEEEGKAKVKQLEQDAKQLEKKQKILQTALEKVEKMRASGRGIFERSFGPQIATLLSNRDNMSEEAYNERVQTLRKQVQVFGKKAGVVRMDYFLNDALGIQPDLARKESDITYKEPQKEADKGRERVRVSRWWKNLFQNGASESDITAIIDRLRKKDPDYLIKIEKGETNEWTDATLQFLFSGRDKDGKEILSSKRRARLNPDNVVKYLEFAKEIAVHGEEVEDAFLLFAEDWTDDHGAEDFEYVFDAIRKGINQPEMKANKLKEVAPLWEKLTGKTLTTPTEVDDIYTVFEMELAAKKMGPAVFLEKLANLPENEKSFINFCFTGRYANTTYIADAGLRFEPDAKNLLEVYKTSNKLFESKPSQFELGKMCKAFKTNGVNLKQLTIAGFEQELTNARTPKRKNNP